MTTEIELRKVTVEEGRDLKNKYICADCGAPLEIAWGGYWGYLGYILRCGIDVAHKGIVKPGRANKDELPIYMKNVLDKKEKRIMEEEYGKEVGTVVAKYQGSTALTRAEATEIIQSFWPGAPEIEVKKAAILCNTYGLNPCMRHLYLIPYKDKKTGATTWVLTLGIGANRLMASRRGPVGYTDGPRIMTADEQLTIRGIVDKVNWQSLCTVSDKHGLSATGYGNYPMRDDNLRGRDKGNSELNMSFIRAERNALDKKFPGEMPTGIDVVDDAYMPVAPKGEVIEGEIVEEQPAETTTDTPKKPITEDQVRAIRTMTGFDDDRLYLEAVNEFGMGIKDITDISERDAGEWIKKLQKGDK